MNVNDNIRYMSMRILQSARPNAGYEKRKHDEQDRRLPTTGGASRSPHLSSTLRVHPRRDYTGWRHHPRGRRRHTARRGHHAWRRRERRELVRGDRRLTWSEPSVLCGCRASSTSVRVWRPPYLPDRHVTGRGTADRWCARRGAAAVRRLRACSCRVRLGVNPPKLEGVAEF